MYVLVVPLHQRRQNVHIPPGVGGPKVSVRMRFEAFRHRRLGVPKSGKMVNVLLLQPTLRRSTGKLRRDTDEFCFSFRCATLPLPSIDPSADPSRTTPAVHDVLDSDATWKSRDASPLDMMLTDPTILIRTIPTTTKVSTPFLYCKGRASLRPSHVPVCQSKCFIKSHFISDVSLVSNSIYRKCPPSTCCIDSPAPTRSPDMARPWYRSPLSPRSHLLLPTMGPCYLLYEVHSGQTWQLQKQAPVGMLALSTTLGWSVKKIMSLRNLQTNHNASSVVFRANPLILKTHHQKHNRPITERPIRKRENSSPMRTLLFALNQSEH